MKLTLEWLPLTTPDPHEAWQKLALTHRYQEALDAFEVLLKGKPKFLPAMMTARAEMLLCLGRLEEALTAFLEANEAENPGWRELAQPNIEMIGAIQWMLGRRAEAMQTMWMAVDRILKRKVGQASTPGAIGQGLLLWYFSVTEDDKSVRDRALAYIDRPAARAVRDFWPGPVALHVLENRCLDDLVAAALSVDLPRSARLVRYRECFALFYAGMKRRAEGDEAGCTALMRRCFAIENPVGEEEWYLARFEAESALSERSGLVRNE